MTCFRAALLASGTLFAGSVGAAPAPVDAATLDRVVVTARLDAAPAFDVPASVETVAVDTDRASARVNVSDLLRGRPGVLARDRQNHAQDVQLSIRGFGARSTFGVRGVRLFADGIPATAPDGQGQVSHFNLFGADRIEILRGPFSALYGNSSGGVVQLWSAQGSDPDTVQAQATVGSDAAFGLGARLLGAAGDVDYNLALSHFRTDGYREHSAARRDSINAKLGVALGDHGRVTLVANSLDAPDARDPLGLTREQARADPRQATSVARQFDTRKSVDQDQLGLVFEQSVGEAQTWRVSAYGGQRDVEQYLAIPASAQANPLHSGGVVDLGSTYAGLDARWSWQGELAGRDIEVTAGANADRQRQHRRGYENFVDDTWGIRGAIRRDERNATGNNDRFAQAWWQVAPRWSVLAGVRHSSVRFRSDDHYIAAGNPDDSGRVTYSETTPVAGIAFAPHDDLRLYLSAGRGFETPTFNELGYRADGGAGLAFDLAPAISDNAELGLKWRNRRGARFTAALFRADTDDELAVARNVGGRSSFRNVGRARRQGLETALTLPLDDSWGFELAYTRLDATFRDTFPICTGAGCTNPSLIVPAGTRIPGVPRDQLFARLQWQGGAWTAGIESLGVGDVTANDAGDARAPGHVLLHLDGARTWPVGDGRVRVFARMENLLDRAAIGSVIVNEGNARYYEPAPGRTFLLGVEYRTR